MDKDIRLIKGVKHSDHREHLTHFNEFDFNGVARYYIIEQEDTNIYRGWHGHQFEKKWFQCIKGEFILGFVKVDNFDNPSNNLIIEKFHLNEQEPVLLCVPEGYVNMVRAIKPGSKLLVYSGKPLEVAKLDSWRWEPSMWGGDKI